MTNNVSVAPHPTEKHPTILEQQTNKLESMSVAFHTYKAETYKQTLDQYRLVLLFLITKFVP